MSTLVDRLNRFISSWKQHDQTSHQNQQHQLQYRSSRSRSDTTAAAAATTTTAVANSGRVGVVSLNTSQATTTTNANIEADQLSNASSTSELINISTGGGGGGEGSTPLVAPRHDVDALIQMDAIVGVTDLNNNETVLTTTTTNSRNQPLLDRIDIVNSNSSGGGGGTSNSNHYYYAITDMENNNSNNNNSDTTPPRLNVVGSATAHTNYQIVQLMELGRRTEDTVNVTTSAVGGETSISGSRSANRTRSSGGRRRRTSGTNNAATSSSSRSNRTGGGRSSSSSGRNSRVVGAAPEVSVSSSTSSSSNGRHRHRHHHNHQHNANYDLFSNFKRRERNLLSACCAIFCVAILAVSLVETRWFYLSGGGCNVNHLGVALFFAPGRVETHREFSKISNREITVVNYVLPSGFVLKNCATVEILIIMRLLIAFIFLAIFSSCAGLILDTFGCMRSGMKMVRRHALFHVLTVVFCLIINGFCFWISERISEQQSETRSKRGKKIDISFDVSYYLVVLASSLSILATAFTLIRRYPSDEDDQLERLLEEYTNFEEPLLHLERSLPAATTNTMPHQHQHHHQFHNPSMYRPMYISTNAATAYQENENTAAVVAGDCTTGGTYSVINNNNSSHFTRSGGGSSGYTDSVTYHQHHQQRQQQQQPPPPPPPSTPPPSLLHSINYSQEVPTSEPPPPYDPTPMHV